MGVSDNIGGQTVYHKYKQDVDSDIINERCQGIIEAGVYTGLWLTKESDSSVRISNGSDSENIIEIADSDVQVKISFDDDVVLTVPEATPFIVLRYLYEKSDTDIYAEWLTLDKASILANDIIIGQTIFVGGDVNTFNYTFRTIPAIVISRENISAFKVTPTATPSTQVEIAAGNITTGKSYVAVPADTSPVFSTASPEDRYDLLYVDLGGSFAIFEGVEGSPPSIPSFENKAVIAIIYRNAGVANVSVQDITHVRPTLFSMAAFSSVVNGHGASMIGVEDAGGHFDEANLEAVLTEIIVDFSATTAGNGASKIGVEDSNGYFDEADVEAIFGEIIEDYASVALGEGASKIGVNDAAGYFTNNTVEFILPEILDQIASVSNGLGASMVGIEDANQRFSGSKNVEAILDEFAQMFVGMYGYFVYPNKPGWLVCNKSTISNISHPQYTALIAHLKAEAGSDVNHPFFHLDVDKAVLPDANGRGLRGIDIGGLGVDPDGQRKSGNLQSDEMKSHNHATVLGAQSSTHTHDMSHHHNGSVTGDNLTSHKHSTYLGPHRHEYYSYSSLGNDHYAADRVRTDKDHKSSGSTSYTDLGSPLSGNESAKHKHTLLGTDVVKSTGTSSGDHEHSVSMELVGGDETRGKNIAAYLMIKY